MAVGGINFIRIVPEWNVKLELLLVPFIKMCIRIVPEWNVKVYMMECMYLLKTD